MLIIQEIVCRWTKKSRGSPGSALRNQVPEKRVVTASSREALSDNWVYQKSIFSEYLKFENPFEQLDVLSPFKLCKYGIVSLSKQDQEILGSLNYGAWEGAPRRDFLEKKIFSLRISDIGKIKYNWRIAYDEGGWAYEKTVINLAHLDKFEPKVFLENEPIYSFQDMPNLW